MKRSHAFTSGSLIYFVRAVSFYVRDEEIVVFVTHSYKRMTVFKVYKGPETGYLILKIDWFE